MNCTECDCDQPYLYSTFLLEGSTMWGFNIGTPIDGEPQILCTKGSYKTKLEAEIAATAFIAGIRFNQGEMD